MPSTLTIPLTTLQPGTQTFGPANVAAGDSDAHLSVDRTVTGGLNSLTAATVLAIAVDQSNDGGTTWQNLAAASAAGGTYIAKNGQPYAVFDVDVKFNPGSNRKARATVIVTGSAVAVAGTLAIS